MFMPVPPPAIWKIVRTSMTKLRSKISILTSLFMRHFTKLDDFQLHIATPLTHHPRVSFFPLKQQTLTSHQIRKQFDFCEDDVYTLGVNIDLA